MSKTQQKPEGSLQTKNALPIDLDIIDDEKGIVGAYVAVIGNKDGVGDIIQPGAFKNWLDKRTPKGVWSHDWNRPIAKTIECYEVSAGDPSLPSDLLGKNLGALYVKMQFNLETKDGQDAYSNVKFFGDDAEWSIGYKTHSESYDRKSAANLLKDVELFEYSPVLFGANNMTSTAFVKAENVGGEMDVRVTGVKEDQIEAIQKAVSEIIGSDEGETELSDEKKDDTPLENNAGDELVDGKKDDEGPGEGTEGGGLVEDHPVETTESLNDGHPVDNSRMLEDDDEDDGKDGESEENEDDDEPNGKKSEDAGEPAGGGGVKLASPKSNRVTEVPEEKEEVVEKSTADEVKVKALPGSYEERYSEIQEAVSQLVPWGYPWIYATFDDHVIYSLYDSREQEQGYWKVAYTIVPDEDNDGSFDVELGEPSAVDIVETVVLKGALEEALKFTTDELVLKVIGEVLGEKAGRVLSTTNQSKLRDALTHIQAVLDANETVTDSETSDEKAHETTDSPEAKIETDEPVVEETPETEEEVEEKADSDTENKNTDAVSDLDWRKSMQEFNELTLSKL